jgi:hypothetical protein
MPLLAQSAEAQSLLSPEPVVKKEASNKPICRREVKTSSRMGAAKICLTRQQWEEKDEARRRDLRQTEGNGGR